MSNLKKNKDFYIFIGSLSQTIKAIKYNWAHNSIDLLLKNIFYQLQNSLSQIRDVPVAFISGLHGNGIKSLMNVAHWQF